MLIKCNKIISPTTKKDLGDESPWLKRGKEYVVLALKLSNKCGTEVCIQAEHFNEPRFIPLSGFEIISQQMPSAWVVTTKDLNNDEKIITMLPKSWSYDSFFDDLEDEKSEAVALFHKEADAIYREEGFNLTF